MAYSSKHVANYFLRRAFREGRSLDPLQIQKLVYISHGRFMAQQPGVIPLIRESFLAWPYGPVEKKLYHHFKQYGGGPIKSLASSPLRTPEISASDLATLAILDAVWEEYGELSGLELSRMTHQPGSPWAITIKEKGEGAVIDNSLIRDHYIEKQARP
jgi:uncharacterized phage-associated protein